MDNIVLVGMPGAGKSTVGVILAKTLGMDFVDTDLEIQRSHGRLLQDIIDESGIAGFLRAEEQTILKGSYNHAVIATGGSVVYSSKAMAHLKKGAVVIYLKVDIGTLQRRINNIATRGIAMSRDQTLNDIYLERTPLYEQYADIIIDCSNKDVEGAVESILGSLNPSNP
jgi:shikimate kinase